MLFRSAKFDSIEGGVQFGTELNNILSNVGGSFDSMYASTLNYDERIKLIIQSIANSRSEIDKMSEVSQRAFVRQLEQTTHLGGQTIQAILKNNDLVNSIDTLTAKQFENVKAAPVEEMAKEFTSIQEKHDAFLTQYFRLGARQEALFDQSVQNVKVTQEKYLKPIADTIASSKNLAQLIKNTSEEFAKISLTKIAEEIGRAHV